MRINIAVCDDEDESLHMIQKELYHAADKLNIEIETYFYNKGKKVLDFIYNEKEDFDILFDRSDENAIREVLNRWKQNLTNGCEK